MFAQKKNKNDPLRDLRIILIRHGKPLFDNTGKKKGLSEEGIQQIKSAAEKIATHLRPQDHVLVLHHERIRSIETASVLAGTFSECVVVQREMPILSNTVAAKAVIRRTWAFIPFALVFTPWMLHVKRNLPKKNLCLKDVRDAAGPLWKLMDTFMIRYEEIALSDIHSHLDSFKEVHESPPHVLILSGSEGSLPLIARGIAKYIFPENNTLAQEAEELTLSHGEYIEIDSDGIQKSA